MEKATVLELAQDATKRLRETLVLHHPDESAIAAQTVRWARSFALVTDDIQAGRARRIRVGELAACVHARETREVAQLSADLILWLFLFDDALGEADPHIDERTHRETLATFTATIRRRRLPDSPTSPFHLALLDLVERAAELGATQDWLDRFAIDMDNYFSGCADESRWRRGNQTPTVDEYRELRSQTVGTSQCFAVIELGAGGEVAAHDMAREEVADIRKRAALLTAWVNDLYSFPKERAAGDPLNLVSTLQNQDGHTTADALEVAVDVYNLELELLESRIAEIRASNCSQSLSAYMDGLLQWVHGNRWWTHMCGRYH